MSADINIEKVVESDNTEKHNSYSSKRFKKVDILIFILCLSLAFIFWCYALYVDDPVVQKNITVNFILDGGEINEFILPTSQKVVVYGERSILSNINSITVKIPRSAFSEYNKDTAVNIEYPLNIKSNTNEIVLQLNYIPN